MVLGKSAIRSIGCANILFWPSKTTNSILGEKQKYHNSCLFGKGKIVDDIRGPTYCNKVPSNKEQNKDSETHSNQDFENTSNEVNSVTSTEESANITLQERLQTLENNFYGFTMDFWPRMQSLIVDCMAKDSKCPDQNDTTHVIEVKFIQYTDVKQEQKDPREPDNSNLRNQTLHCTKRLTGPTGRTYKPTNRNDFIYESNGKKKDKISTQTPIQITEDKEAIMIKNINSMPDTNELQGEKKRKQNNQTPKENSEVYIVPSKTYTEAHQRVPYEVIDAYIHCLRDKEKGIKAFLEQAIRTALLNIEGAHAESNKPHDK
uniref:Uncharacterized protein n=1 Tax=Oryza punctata TaxID=4537 RepID=A0A0E0LL56_ORYPU